MKKTLLALFIVLALPISAFCAGTVVETIIYDHKDDFGHAVKIQYAITGDASAGTVPDHTIALFTVDDTNSSKSVYLQNFFLYDVETIPGAGGDAPDAYTVDVKDSDGFSLCDISARSTSAKEDFPAYQTIGKFPQITEDWTLSTGAVGNSNTTTIILHFLK